MSTHKTPTPDEKAKAKAKANVLLIIDAESLLLKYVKPSLETDSPTPIDDGFIFILGGSHLATESCERQALHINLGESVYLRARTIALRAEHSVVVYSFRISDTSRLTAPELIVKPAQPLPTLDTENPLQPLLQYADDHYWLVQAVSDCEELCELRFMLLNNQGEAAAHFSWKLNIKTE